MFVTPTPQVRVDSRRSASSSAGDSNVKPERQSDQRYRKRLPCNLGFGGHQYPGLVLNLSRGGLFVQTSLGARPGSDVDVVLTPLNADAPIELQARVVWKRVVPQRLRNLQQGGVGLVIAGAPSQYEGLISDMESSYGGRSSTTVSLPAIQTYRARLSLQGTPRTRWLDLHAESNEDALSQLYDEFSQGWVLLELEES